MFEKKIELHCHLDGSLRPETVQALLHSPQSLDALHEELIAPENCDSLDTYLKRFDLPIKALQTASALSRVTYELLEDAANEHVTYIEVRFAPHLHIQEGLSLFQVIQSVVDGLKRAEAHLAIKGNIILSYLRNTPVEGFYEMADAGKHFLGKGVVAVDLCGGERDLFSSRFVDAVAYAKSLGYAVTIHAGETGIEENIQEAILLLGATRIGHGVAMQHKQEILELVKSRGVTIECCPTSNVQTKAVSDMTMHPIDRYLKNDIRITVNTDNRTVSNTTMSNEMALLESHFLWGEDAARAVYKMAVDASFADDETKAWLMSFLSL